MGRLALALRGSVAAGALLVAIVSAAGCGDSASTANDAAIDGEVGGSGGSGGTSGASGSGGTSGSGGAGGADGGEPTGNPTSTTPFNVVQTVAAGGVVKSKSYRMVLSLGEATATPGDASSKSFHLVGGLKGAVGGAP